MSKFFDGWAPPLTWGPEVTVLKLFGSSTNKLIFNNISDAPSSYTAEVIYWDGQWQNEEIAVPGKGEFEFTNGNCVCDVKVRSKVIQ